ncbi:MAG TPA: tetratricopeptide repeat protein [Allosphingosinicella sp.]|nr:tetratricopeptide repeat protein [Allosphingosinicella sp.]
MPFIAGSIVLLVLCGIHCIVYKKHIAWILILVMFPLLGPLAYILVEILIPFGQRRELKAARERIVERIDPEREIRAAREALDMADTVANRMRFADALAAQGRWPDAVVQYEQADGKTPAAADRTIRLRLATACFEAGQAARARELLEALPDTGPQIERDRLALLHARLLEEAGESEQALAIYAEIGERMAGAEAQCRRAGLLIALGRRREALQPLADAGRRARHMDPYLRAKDGEMYDWAAATLAELRAEYGQSGS